jgi:hypothetical protein
MSRLVTLIGAGAVVLMTASASMAAPCTTGTAGQKSAQDKSSNVEPGSTANVTPGAKAESPGTVGAMNNVGANRATSAQDVSKQAEGKPMAGQQDGC